MFTAVEVWNIGASIVSVIVGVIAIMLSIYFFVTNRKTEKDVSNSLTKIETQAETLQRITGSQMDRLTKYVTEQKSSAIDESLPKLLAILTELPQTIFTQTQQVTGAIDEDTSINELISCYIGLYFYAMTS